MIKNTMLFQFAVLAWLFLGEHLTLAESAGIVLAAVGTLVVQVCAQGGGQGPERPSE